MGELRKGVSIKEAAIVIDAHSYAVVHLHAPHTMSACTCCGLYNRDRQICDGPSTSYIVDLNDQCHNKSFGEAQRCIKITCMRCHSSNSSKISSRSALHVRSAAQVSISENVWEQGCSRSGPCTCGCYSHTPELCQGNTSIQSTWQRRMTFRAAAVHGAHVTQRAANPMAQA